MENRRFKIIASEIGNPVVSGTTFFTRARWSSYHLLEYLLKIAGKSRVMMSSFSFSEDSLRAYHKLQKAGLIESFSFIANLAVKSYKSDLMNFAKKVFTELKTGNIHSKITYIESATHRFAINQSANSTRNPAHEAGVIFIGDDTLIYKKEIEALIHGQTLRQNRRIC